MWLLLAFLAVPLLEIALFIQIGGVLGLGWTLLIVVATAILGAAMVRSQGSKVMNDVRRSFSEVRDPSEPLAHGAMILFAGALLLTPGFFTDTVGFALLLPQFGRGRSKQYASVFMCSRFQASKATMHIATRASVLTLSREITKTSKHGVARQMIPLAGQSIEIVSATC